MNYLNFILIFLFLTFTACSNNDLSNESIDEENNLDKSTETSREDIRNETEETGQYDYNYNSGSRDLSERPPRIKSIKVEALSNNLKDGFNAVVKLDDSEGNDVNFIYQWKHNGIDIIGATEQKLEWNEEFKKGDTVTLEIIPYDDLSEGIWKSEGSFTIPNSPPVIGSPPSGLINGTSFKYQVEATDLDDDPLTYSLQNAPVGMTINPDTGEVIWEYGIDDKGEYKIGIEVSDDDGGRSFYEMSITVN